MPVTFAERYDTPGSQQGTTFAGFRGETHTRRFNVPGAWDSDALAHASLPAAWSAHPRIAGLIAIGRRATERLGANEGWVVEVAYGLNRIDGSIAPPPPPDQTEVSYKKQTTRTIRETLVVPLVCKTPIIVPVPGSVPTFTTFDSYTVSSFEIPLTKTVYQMRCNKFGYTGADSDAIANQDAKIHTISGRKWLFNGAYSDEIEKGVWTIDYEWVNDPGTPSITIPPGAGAQQYLVVPARQPFYKYVLRKTIPSGSNNELVEIITQPMYDEDATGHLGLPGTPF